MLSCDLSKAIIEPLIDIIKERHDSAEFIWLSTTRVGILRFGQSKFELSINDNELILMHTQPAHIERVRLIFDLESDLERQFSLLIFDWKKTCSEDPTIIFYIDKLIEEFPEHKYAVPTEHLGYFSH